MPKAFERLPQDNRGKRCRCRECACAVVSQRKQAERLSEAQSAPSAVVDLWKNVVTLFEIAQPAGVDARLGDLAVEATKARQVSLHAVARIFYRRRRLH